MEDEEEQAEGIQRCDEYAEQHAEVRDATTIAGATRLFPCAYDVPGIPAHVIGPDGAFLHVHDEVDFEALATMIDHINRTMDHHIITMEDPIEYYHEHKMSIVNQREIGLDTKSYNRALKSAVRAAPDVIQIGEIRDTESMRAALDIAGTGHLVLATVHSNNAPETLDRIINLFPQEQHLQVFMDLAHYLRAILSQRLVRARNGKLVAAVELLLNTPHIKDLILKGDISAVKEAHRDSGEQGMVSFDDALLNLYKKGTITMDEAMSHADSRANLEAKVNFGG